MLVVKRGGHKAAPQVAWELKAHWDATLDAAVDLAAAVLRAL
jgi:hypothetical protein